MPHWVRMNFTNLLLVGVLAGSMGGAVAQDALPDRSGLLETEEGLLSRLQRCAFDFFWYEAHPETGLVKDRAGNDRGDDYTVASVASTGFGLASLAIGVEHDWISRDQARERALLTLRFVRDKLEEKEGWLYHFVDWKTGQRVWTCEVSSIDTALFLAGALLAGENLGGSVEDLAEEIYRRVNFRWMLTDGGERPEEKLLGHGWKPESGHLRSRWDSYSEHLILNLLAIGSPTHPIPGSCWDAWSRNIGEYKGFRTFACGPLFTHQYSQAFVDFRGLRDRGGHDYFESAVAATRANRQFCIDQAARFKTYGVNVWGLSACDVPGGGYRAYGAPPGRAVHDGTVAPWSTVAAVCFTPDAARAAVQEMHERFPGLWGRYGFGNSFNLDRNWFARDVIGIDLGAAILLIENHRSGMPWRTFMKLSCVQAGMKRAGLSREAVP